MKQYILIVRNNPYDHSLAKSVGPFDSAESALDYANLHHPNQSTSWIGLSEPQAPVYRVEIELDIDWPVVKESIENTIAILLDEGGYNVNKVTAKGLEVDVNLG